MAEIKDIKVEIDAEIIGVEKIKQDKAHDREILRKQLELLAKFSENFRCDEGVGNVSLAMCEIYKLLYKEA